MVPPSTRLRPKLGQGVHLVVRSREDLARQGQDVGDFLLCEAAPGHLRETMQPNLGRTDVQERGFGGLVDLFPFEPHARINVVLGAAQVDHGDRKVHENKITLVAEAIRSQEGQGLAELVIGLGGVALLVRPAVARAPSRTAAPALDAPSWLLAHFRAACSAAVSPRPCHQS